MNSDKSHSSSAKSNYSSAVHPYQRVLTSFSTGTKKKVKVAGATVETHGTPTPGNTGGKLYDKIRSGVQATHKQPLAQPTATQAPKKKP